MPVSGKNERKAEVYVLDRFISGRPVRSVPGTNAALPDTNFFYDEGVYDDYPIMKKRYEQRQRAHLRKVANMKAWGRGALIALDDGGPLPPTDRLVLPEVMRAMYRAGHNGLTRPEMCRVLGRDGGKISGVMTDLHAARIIYPLEGVRR